MHFAIRGRKRGHVLGPRKKGDEQRAMLSGEKRKKRISFQGRKKGHLVSNGERRLQQDRKRTEKKKVFPG